MQTRTPTHHPTPAPGAERHATDPPSWTSTVHGYPRLGRRRELKRAIEGHWAGTHGLDQVSEVARDLRVGTWRRLRELGLDAIPSNVASTYDQVLDACVLVDAIPERFRQLRDTVDDGGDADPERLALRFAMARGTPDAAPMEMTKWFDTNYHNLVPEIDPDTPFGLADDQPLRELRESAAIGIDTRPVLLGPFTLLALAKAADDAPAGFDPLTRLDELTAVYTELLAHLAAEGASWVQLDEPALVTDRTDDELAALDRAYATLVASPARPALYVASYFGRLGDALPILVDRGVDAVGVDLTATDVEEIDGIDGIEDTTVVAGVVDGRNVWRADLDGALDQLRRLADAAGEVVVSTSCSLLHVPHDVEEEHDLDPRLRAWLAFADQKVAEVVTLARTLEGDTTDELTQALAAAREARASREDAPWLRDNAVRARIDALDGSATTRTPAGERRQQQIELPLLPTTTIGSFPQTAEIRRARADHRAGRLDDDGYRQRMLGEIERVVRLQEELGLDVLVHGEPERNDMVQYFAEQLHGFVATRHGWVQSYGTRAVRPPILYGDVARRHPMTVDWYCAAQALTTRPVKGMLTGPVTMLAWSFVRDDQPLADTARQVALAIRDEVADLEEAGARIVQVDEPTLRELLPPRAADHAAYLDWAVGAFRLATSGVADHTQIHTHLCYSEFGDVIGAIDALDADVTTVEAARSRMEVVDELAAAGFARDVGPGVYDIHSPRVPSIDELRDLLRRAVRSAPAERVWANPDCGLKTRGYAEVEPALRNLVEAAALVRDELTGTTS